MRYRKRGRVRSLVFEISIKVNKLVEGMVECGPRRRHREILVNISRLELSIPIHLVNFRLAMVLRLMVPSLKPVEFSQPHHTILINLVVSSSRVVVMIGEVGSLIMVIFGLCKKTFSS